MHCRTPVDAWLNSGTVWSDKDSDLNQFLMFDLGKVMNVITITTKGRSHTNNYVSGFIIQYGTNNWDFGDLQQQNHPQVQDLRGERADHVSHVHL